MTVTTAAKMTIERWLDPTDETRKPLRPLQFFHMDIPLLFGILLLSCAGLVVLFGATNQNPYMLEKQGIRLVIALTVMVLCAQVPPTKWKVWAPWLFAFAFTVLLSVLVIGDIGKGAQRWLDLGILRFQPAELMKLALPMMLAWYYNDRVLPPSFVTMCVGMLLILAPALVVIKQPDLGTAIMIMFSGAVVLLLAGMRWRYIVAIFVGLGSAFPILWHYMHDYQKQRVLTFLNPERDPLGTGYHIIQSKIAIGSGGIFGKGWLTGTQSRLHFLPENATDFIFAVTGEEFGLVGCLTLITIYLFITARCLYICMKAQTTFARLLAGALAASFFSAFFVNMGMVSGMLPVVGIPLPLVSYGGTSMVTIMASFGILMSIHTHRQLVTR